LEGFAPLPTETSITATAQAKAALRGLMGVQRGLEEYASQAGPVRRGLVDIAGKIPGGALVTSWFDPKGNVTNSAALFSRQLFVYMLTGKQINDTEMMILEQAFPRIGENIETARPKFQSFFGYLYAILKQRSEITPGLIDPELLDMAARGAGMMPSQSSQPGPYGLTVHP
jgi:hypothetical protein